MRYLVIIALMLVLTGCTLIQSPDTELPPAPSVKNDAEKPINQTAEETKLRKYIPYVNKKYGFELKLPGEWEGFASAERVLDWGELGKNDSIDFGFKKDGEIESLFNISIYSKAQWKKLQASEGPVPTFLGEDEGLVLGWSISQAASDEIMMIRRSEVESIVKSFTWIEIQ